MDPEQLRTAGFASGSDIYERGRPGYPGALVDRLAAECGLGPGCPTLDLAAGTGKLTRQLRATGAPCVAAEPSAAMRTVFADVLPGAPLVGGSAERLPFARGVFGLVTVAQAFHWFDADRALPEMARVLRLSGAVALIWNERDESVPWVAELGRLMLSSGQSPHSRASDFQARVDAEPALTASERWQFTHRVEVDRSGLVDLVASRSYVNVLDPVERQRLLAAVAGLADSLPEPVAMPYVTDVYVARRVGREEDPRWCA